LAVQNATNFLQIDYNDVGNSIQCSGHTSALIHNLLLEGVIDMPDGACACGGSCGCGENHAQTEQVYLTKEEYVLRLEQYLQDLKAEITAVEEELAQLREPAVTALASA
jgi:hypothetical protein